MIKKFLPFLLTIFMIIALALSPVYANTFDPDSDSDYETIEGDGDGGTGGTGETPDGDGGTGGTGGSGEEDPPEEPTPIPTPTYTVTIDYCNPSKTIEKITDLEENSSISEPDSTGAGHTWTGYDLVGWYTTNISSKQTASSKWNFEENVVNKDITLYAKWALSPIDYKITFDVNIEGVETPDYKMVTAGKTYGTLTYPEKAGYSFLGWYTEREGGTRIEGNTTLNTPGDRTLYAHWNHVQYKISFDGVSRNARVGYPNEGDSAFRNIRGESRYIEETYANEYGQLPIAKLSGYEFIGWYTTKTEGGEVIDTTTTLKEGNDHSIYARYKPHNWKITFKVNADDADPLDEDEKTLDVKYGELIGALPTPTRKGFKFIGWNNMSNGTGVTYKSDTKYEKDNDTTLYAVWELNSNKVFFDPTEGNELPDEEKSKMVTWNKPYGTLPTPTHSDSGFYFGGWFTSTKGYGTQIKSTDIVSSVKKTTDPFYSSQNDQTLYAYWIAHEYSVTFVPNGGSISTTKKEVVYKDNYGELPTPTKTGYDFLGWYTESTGGQKVTKSSIVDIADNHTLYARWNLARVAVTYDPNGGKISGNSTYKPITKYVTYSQNYSDMAYALREGYHFEGWYTAQVNGGTQVTTGTKVTNDKPHILYARWSVLNYTVTLNSMGGECAKESFTISQEIGRTFSELEDAKREGYDFDGWFTAENGGNKVVTTSSITTWGNQILYAHWSPKVIQVTFDANGGKCATTATKLAYDSTYGMLPDATKQGFIFNGWFTKKTGGTQITEDTVISIVDNHTIYAQWTAIPTPVPTKTPTKEPTKAPTPTPKPTPEPKKKGDPQVQYRTSLIGSGWGSFVKEGETSGQNTSSGKLDGIKIKLNNVQNGDIEYTTNIIGSGWESGWRVSNQVSGPADGKGKICAIKIKLNGTAKNKYNLYYRVRVPYGGWLGWAKNGEVAGAVGYSYAINAIQMVMIEKGGIEPEEVNGITSDMPKASYKLSKSDSKPLVKYCTYKDTEGWNDFVSDGTTCGTGSKRIEGIKIKLGNRKYSGSIKYRSRIQKKGWEKKWKSNGKQSGAPGKSLRTEAIQIKLTGEMSKHYDVYYRVKSQKLGWLGWAKNGESAGTQGYGYKLYGMQIVLVEKGGIAPGSSKTAYKIKNLK